jgi:UDP-GlcNAc:undecaprenyl-phosphate GlcNAc-1-phosphate transferase
MLKSLILIFINTIFLNLFYKFNFSLAKKFNLFDKPDLKRKIHKKKVPITGGFFFLIFFICNHFINSDLSLVKNIYLVFFFICFFFIGICDDILNLRPSSKVIFIFFLSLIFISINKNYMFYEFKIIINNNLSYYYKDFNAIIISAVFLTALIIVFNLIDGVNGLAVTLFMTWLVFLNINKTIEIFIVFFYSLNFFFYYFINQNNKSFLGSSGNILLSLTLYINTIYQYNNNLKFDLLYILIFFYLPFLDAIRLFLERISNQKNPFEADKKHLHHYLITNIYFKKSYLFIFFLMSSFPLFLLLIMKINTLVVLIISIIIYILTLFIMRNSNNKVS